MEKRAQRQPRCDQHIGRNFPCRIAATQFGDQSEALLAPRTVFHGRLRAALRQDARGSPKERTDKLFRQGLCRAVGLRSNTTGIELNQAARISWVVHRVGPMHRPILGIMVSPILAPTRTCPRIQARKERCKQLGLLRQPQTRSLTLRLELVLAAHQVTHCHESTAQLTRQPLDAACSTIDSMIDRPDHGATAGMRLNSLACCARANAETPLAAVAMRGRLTGRDPVFLAGYRKSDL